MTHVPHGHFTPGWLLSITFLLTSALASAQEPPPVQQARMREIGDVAHGPARSAVRNPRPAFGAGVYGVTWTSGHADAWFTRLDADGQPLDERSTQLASPASINVFTPGFTRTEFDGTSFRAFWKEGQRLLSARVSAASGAAQPALTIATLSGDGVYDTAAGPNGIAFTAWCDQDGKTRGIRINGRDEILDTTPLTLTDAATCHDLMVRYHAGRFVVFPSYVSSTALPRVTWRMRTVAEDGELSIATTEVDSQELGAGAWFVAAAASNGKVLVFVWGDASRETIYLRRMDAHGAWLQEQPTSLPSPRADIELASDAHGFMLLSKGNLSWSARYLSSLGVAESEEITIPSQQRLRGSSRDTFLSGGADGYLATTSSSIDDQGDAEARVPSDLGYSIRIGSDRLARAPHYLVRDEVEQRHPSLVWSGEHYLALWVDNRDGWERLALRTRKLSREGKAIQPQSTKLFELPWANVLGTAMASNGATSLVVWAATERPERSARIYYAAIDDNGALLTPPTQLTTTVLGARNPVVASNGDGFMLAWREQRAGDRDAADVFAATVDGLGKLTTKAPVNVALGPDFGGQRNLTRLALAWTGSH